MTYRKKQFRWHWVTLKVVPTASLLNVIFTRATLRYSAVCLFAIVASPSVCPSYVGVMLRRLNAEFQKHHRKISPKDLYEIPMGSNCVCWPAEVFGSDLPPKVCVHPTVVRVHNGALAEEDAMSSTNLVIVALWWSQLRSSWHQQGWSYESLLMTPTFIDVCDTKHRMLAVR